MLLRHPIPPAATDWLLYKQNPYNCYGGCATSYRRSDARQRHWDKSPDCEGRHAVAVEGTVEGERMKRRRVKLQQEQSRRTYNLTMARRRSHSESSPGQYDNRSVNLIGGMNDPIEYCPPPPTNRAVPRLGSTNPSSPLCMSFPGKATLLPLGNTPCLFYVLVPPLANTSF